MNFNQCNVVYFLETHLGPEKIGLINISKFKWAFHPCDFTIYFMIATPGYNIATAHANARIRLFDPSSVTSIYVFDRKK